MAGTLVEMFRLLELSVLRRLSRVPSMGRYPVHNIFWMRVRVCRVSGFCVLEWMRNHKQGQFIDSCFVSIFAGGTSTSGAGAGSAGAGGEVVSS